MPNILLTSFNGGELSPMMDSRSDLAKYASGCRRLENMLVTPHGGVFRRPGTEYLGTAKLADRRCRLLGFNFSTTTRFVLEFGHNYLRVWGNGVLVESSPGVPLEIVTPYDEAHLRELQTVQVNDVLYIAHSNYAVRKLTRVADDNWTLAEVAWTYPPTVDLEPAFQEITASANTGSITLTAPASFFTAADIGTELVLSFRKAVQFIEGGISANAFWGPLPLSQNADWDFQTTGIWDATVGILRKTPAEMAKLSKTTAVAVTRSGTTATATIVGHGWTTGDSVLVIGAAPFGTTSGTASTITVTGADTFTYTVANSGATSGTVEMHNISKMETVRTYNSNGDRNITGSGTQPEASQFFVQVSNYTSNTNAKFVLEGRDYLETGRVRIDAVASGTSATATVLDYLGKWTGSRQSVTAAQSAFCAKYGYARTVAIHEQRLCFAGTNGKPQNIWCSATNDFENFELGVADDDAMQFTIAASEGNRINWLYSQKLLMLGTSGDEWTIGAADTAGAFTATNVQVKRQAGYGSQYMRAVLISDILLFVQRQGRKLREWVYNFDRDGYVAPDLTVLAEHITAGEITELAYSHHPNAVVWAIRGDGQLIGMTYERDQEVIGWHRHTTQGEFESVATIYGLDGADDEVWVAVKRTVNGSTVRYIERLRPDWRTAYEAETAADWWFLDCAKRYSGTETTTITGLSHLEGKTVKVLADGAARADAVVASGQITLDRAASKVLVGLAYDSVLQPMKIVYDDRGGSTRGRNLRINRIVASLYKSLSGQFSTNGTEWLEFYSRDFNDPMDTPPPVFSGEKEVVGAGGYGLDAAILLRQNRPYPFTVRSLVIKLESHGD
jgi:hypothetical protein